MAAEGLQDEEDALAHNFPHSTRSFSVQNTGIASRGAGDDGVLAVDGEPQRCVAALCVVIERHGYDLAFADHGILLNVIAHTHGFASHGCDLPLIESHSFPNAST